LPASSPAVTAWKSIDKSALVGPQVLVLQVGDPGDLPGEQVAQVAPAEICVPAVRAGHGGDDPDAHALADVGLDDVGVLSIADFKPRDLARERLLLVVSAHGNGEPPDSARELHAEVHGRRAPQLPELRYAVLGLGDSSYVQHRLRAETAELHGWLAEGAHRYVCGATAMGQAVHDALLDVAARGGGLGEEAARAFIDGLRSTGRYQRDLY
jgi:sulfite reductase alpha subunit-like flavoprotein